MLAGLPVLAHPSTSSEASRPGRPAQRGPLLAQTLREAATQPCGAGLAQCPIAAWLRLLVPGRLSRFGHLSLPAAQLV